MGLLSAASASVVVLALLAGCGADSGAMSESDLDAAAYQASTHFSNVYPDITDGVLTDEEARAKISEVYDRTLGSEESVIQTKARTMLATATQQPSGFQRAADDFAQECLDQGWDG